MQQKRKSGFKDQQKAINWFQQWVAQLEHLNKKRYERIELETSLGKTCVWGLNTNAATAETIVIFPGARTSSLFWDLDNGLASLQETYRIFLVETNGLPNLSDGNTPDITSLDYGEWALEILDQLKIEKAYVAGASFGGLVCLKLCRVAPTRVIAAFLLNPGCLQPFSLSTKNLYYNLLPILFPSRKNILTFLDKAILQKPNHDLPVNYKELLIDYELFALTQYKDNTQKPYYMKGELNDISTDVSLIVGESDLLFPFEKSIVNAQRELKSLREVITLPNVGHGIETYQEAIQLIKTSIERLTVAQL
jgi:pimeloyl-ACP methyl ester carboxylesterase